MKTETMKERVKKELAKMGYTKEADFLIEKFFILSKKSLPCKKKIEKFNQFEIQNK